jgi:hypothetical protein
MVSRLVSFFVFVLLVVSSTGSAQTLRVTGIYSNLTYNKEGGDLLGMELLIVPSVGAKPAYSAFVQIAEGGAPFTALVPVKVSGSQIEFTLPTGGAYDGAHFVGTLNDAGLIIRWSHGAEERLKRGKSYWQ